MIGENQMELKTYLQILMRKWWIIIPAFLVTLTTTVVLTFTQVPIYESNATFVVAPNSAFQDVKSFASGLDILSRRAEISTTYAEVAASRRIKQQAADTLGLSPTQRENLSVDSQLIAGTNVLKVTVESDDPVVARDFADMVGGKTIDYVRNLYDAYELRPLDQASMPLTPIRPNKVLNIVLGAAGGLTLGVGLAFLSHFLQAPDTSAPNLNILDSKTGLYNRRYFAQRLREEMSRAKRNDYPLAVALMNVDYLGTLESLSPQARDEAVRKVALMLRQYLHDEEIVARMNETVLAFLLPNTPGAKARADLERLQTRLSWTPFEDEQSGVKLNLVGVTGIADYQRNGINHDELVSQATRALQEAETAGQGEVYLLADTMDPDVGGDDR